MNQDQDNNLPSAENDPLLSAEYRAIAKERTSPALDAIVLKQARAAASRLQSFTALWFRPLAFVATLVLSLALVLELTNTPELQSPKSPETEVGRREAESFEVDPNFGVPRHVVPHATSEFRMNADSPAGKQQSPEPSPPTEAIGSDVATGGRQRLESAPSAVNAPVVEEEVSADFAEMIEASSMQMPDADSVTQNAIQGLKQSRSAEEVQVGDVASFSASAVSPDVLKRPCAEEQTADAERWWQCIADLEEAGRHDEAKIEIELFKTVYPDFEIPEELPSK